MIVLFQRIQLNLLRAFNKEGKNGESKNNSMFILWK